VDREPLLLRHHRTTSRILAPATSACLYPLSGYRILSGDCSWRPDGIFQSYQELPQIHEIFLDVVFFAFLILLVFGIFFLAIRRGVRQTLATVDSKQGPHYSPAEASQEKIRAVLEGEAPPPMSSSEGPAQIDVFVSGHTHLPSLVKLDKGNGKRNVMVNSGCWLRQLQPIVPHLKGPPTFASRFVLTHVRVFVKDSSLQVELWEHPEPADQHPTRIERLLSWKRRPPQPPPRSKPRLRAASVL
jgi:hypothetical protein